jgi:hypothetical protein
MNKKTILCTLIVSLFAFAHLAMADYSVMSTGGGPLGVGPWGYGDGGEFTFTTGGLDTSAYDVTTKNQAGTTNTFQTFCIEQNVTYNPGQPYYGVLGDNDISHDKPLNYGAAWLYSQFAKGVLTGYDYTNTNTGRNASAGIVQQEIWYLMGQSTTYDVNLNNLVTNAINASGHNVYDASNGAYGVQVLNLYVDSSHTQIAQDQLFLTPTPIPAAAWLFGSGLMGLIGLKRRKA